MTFLEMQDNVMDTLNRTSPEARVRVKSYLNQRLREVQSTLNLARTRRGIVTVDAVSGQAIAVVSGVAKILGIYDDEVRHDPLVERTLAQLLEAQAEVVRTGVPDEYAIDEHLNDVVKLRWEPVPDDDYEFDADALLAGVDLVDDDDEPTFPADFHDVLVLGAMADELMKMEKYTLAAAREKKFEERVRDLRFFLVKSRGKALVQDGRRSLDGRRRRDTRLIG